MKGAKAVANSLEHNTSLQKLELVTNNITVKGATTLLLVLIEKNITLESLSCHSSKNYYEAVDLLLNNRREIQEAILKINTGIFHKAKILASDFGKQMPRELFG